MTFDQLIHYISKDMKMSHVYQPLMLMTLLKHGGQASESTIAKAILELDPVQQKYYEDRVRNMVGVVLQKNGVTTRTKAVHALNDFDSLSQEQINGLLALLQRRLAEEMVDRGEQFFKHRATDREVISGSVRFQVLERAKGRCECCGISKEDRPLDVDHIIPRSKKGKNDLSNYQALCWLCNANKGNRSTTDFRNLEAFYATRTKGCLFCDAQVIDRQRIVAENDLAYATRDGFPVAVGHTLFIPKRHALDYFELVQAEVNAINALMADQKALLQREDPTIEGFNIGMNCGEVAGQSVFHCHVHLIPRRVGDVEKPKGGVRNLMPGKGHY